MFIQEAFWPDFAGSDTVLKLEGLRWLTTNHVPLSADATLENTLSNSPPAAPSTYPNTYQVFTSREKIAATNQTVGCFRIPSMTRSPSGTLLAFAEGRLNGCRPDFMAGRPIVVRASHDDGKTWGDVKVAMPADPSYGFNYPAAVKLEDRVLLLASAANVSASSVPTGTYASLLMEHALPLFMAHTTVLSRCLRLLQ